ncbi:MAG: hypothetical protein RIC55_05690 [Pirellulaceae bacterium]
MASTSTTTARRQAADFAAPTVKAPRVEAARAQSSPVEAPVHAEQEYHFDVPAEFPIFGRWRESAVHIAVEEHARNLAYWLASHSSPEVDDDALWRRCIEQHPASFNALHAMELFDSSLDLPRGTVVFQSIEAPPWIKDDPPGEILDRLAAVQSRFPKAEIWLHEPVYRRPADNEAPELLTAEALHEEARRAREAVWDEYRASRRRLRAALQTRRVLAGLRDSWRLYHRRRAVQRKAVELRRSGYRSSDLLEVAACLADARELGLETEGDFLQLTAYGPKGMSAAAVSRARAYYASASAWTDLRDALLVLRSTELAVMTGLAVAAVPVGMLAATALPAVPALLLLPAFILIDPILTFTLPEDRCRHWFIGHWDWRPNPDGGKSLIYI